MKPPNTKQTEQGPCPVALSEINSKIIEQRSIVRMTAAGRKETEDFLLREDLVPLRVDGRLETEFSCLPQCRTELAVGYCRTNGMLGVNGRGLACVECAPDGSIELSTKEEANWSAEIFKDGAASFTAKEIHRLQETFEERCSLYRFTGAAHSVALASKNGILLFMEDVARHNALDKVIGAMALWKVPALGRMLIFSGRLARDMVHKAASSGVKVLVAPGAPTLAAVVLAEQSNMTLMGFVRRDNINIYTHPERIVG